MWDNLTMAQKNELMKTYIKAGVKDLPSMINHYNTYAKGGPKKTYKEWLTSMQERYPDIEFDSNKAQYDYERYFNENYKDAMSRLAEDSLRHFTDKYKLPSHITFSDESVYSTPRNKGGRWVGDDMFVPSAYNAERYPWLYKAYIPISEEDIYSHRFATGGPEDELYSAGTLPEVAVTASRIYDKDFEKTYKKYGKYAGISNKSQAYNRWLNDQDKLDAIKAKREEASKRALGVTAVGAALPFVTAGAIQVAPYIANAAGRAGMSKAGQFVKGALDATTPGTEVFSALPNAVKYGVLGANSVIGGMAADEFRKNPTVETGANFVLSNPWTFNAVGKTPQALKFIGSGVNKTGQFLASPYTGKWIRFGNKMYRFKPGYIGMNGTPIESKKVIDYNKSIKDLIPNYNKFAEYYGYNQVPDDVSISKAEDIIKEGLARHNTFYRGIELPTENDVVKIKSIIGNNASDIDILEYLAKTGSKNPANTYFSQDSRAGQYGENVGIFKRRYTLGEDPRTWIEDADFTYDITPATKDAPKGKVNYPWASEKFIENSYPGEVRINPEDYTFEGWLPQEEWNPNGKIIKYVSPDAYKGSGNRWFNEKQGQYKPNFTSKETLFSLGEESSYESSEPVGDLFKFEYQRMLSGEKPILGEDWANFIPEEHLGTTTSIPQGTKDILLNSTMPRMRAMRKGYKEGTFEPEFNEAINTKYTEFPKEAFDKAGIHEKIKGTYYPNTDFINMKSGTNPEHVLPHEVRHRIDTKIGTSTKEIRLLQNAYGRDFNELPRHVEKTDILHDYKNIEGEKVTTNLDARNKLLGLNRAKSMSVEDQNMIIDRASDERIVSAVRDANGYSKRFIEYLEKNNKLTTERIKAIREAMKYVGGVSIPIGIGLSTKK